MRGGGPAHSTLPTTSIRISTLVLRKPYPTWSPLIRVYTHGEGALVLSMDEAKSADHFAFERDV